MYMTAFKSCSRFLVLSCSLVADGPLVTYIHIQGERRFGYWPHGVAVNSISPLLLWWRVESCAPDKSRKKLANLHKLSCCRPYTNSFYATYMEAVPLLRPTVIRLGALIQSGHCSVGQSPTRSLSQAVNLCLGTCPGALLDITHVLDSLLIPCRPTTGSVSPLNIKNGDDRENGLVACAEL
jgi:hypothetical protein